MVERHRELLQKGYLLHARPYGDTSSLLEVFAREQGRVGLVAKGARSPRARRRGLLQPFQELVISWVGRGELYTLTDVEATGRAVTLTGDALISGFYLNELLLRLLRRDDPHPELFEDYRSAVSALASGAAPAPLLRVFERRLLDKLGYGLVLDHDIAGEPVVPELRYRYRPDEGLVLDARQTGGGISGAALLALAGEDAQGIAAHALDTRNLLREALAPHIGERPLKSRELFRTRRLDDASGNQHE